MIKVGDHLPEAVLGVGEADPEPELGLPARARVLSLLAHRTSLQRTAAFLLHQGKAKVVARKSLLPTYDVFDEDRYFEPGSTNLPLRIGGRKVGVTICEDIWNMGNDPLYRICPMDMMKHDGPDLMINLSASPFDYTHDADRKAVIKSNVLKYGIPLFYCNAIGSQTEIVFDGGSMVFDRAANLCGQLSSFKEELKGFLLKDDGTVEGSVLQSAIDIPGHLSEPVSFDPALNIEKIYNALVEGIRDYFSKMGFQQAILGSSGGIDSAVTLAIACEALGKENVRAVLMPSQYSSAHSVDDAVALSKNLGNPYDIISIQPAVDALLSDLQPYFQNKPFNVAEENAQSRMRCNVLMTLANKFGNILLNTSNKSELSTGYGTLYGDMAGGLAVLGSEYHSTPTSPSNNTPNKLSETRFGLFYLGYYGYVGVISPYVSLFFAGRGYNIESLTVAEIDRAARASRITVVTSGTPAVIEQIKAQLGRLVPVHRVVDITTEKPGIEREMALVKVAGTGDKRVDNALVDHRIRAAVGSRLQAKGYTAPVNGTPDFYVAYHVAVKDRLKGSSNVQYKGDWAFGTYTTISDIHAYNEGDLEAATFLDRATDYYQVYDVRKQHLALRSQGLKAAGVKIGRAHV